MDGFGERGCTIRLVSKSIAQSGAWMPITSNYGPEFRRYSILSVRVFARAGYLLNHSVPQTPIHAESLIDQDIEK
jgi:hypothetical protein